jgi:hypothetical protein
VLGGISLLSSVYAAFKKPAAAAAPSVPAGSPMPTVPASTTAASVGADILHALAQQVQTHNLAAQLGGVASPATAVPSTDIATVLAQIQPILMAVVSAIQQQQPVATAATPAKT